MADAISLRSNQLRPHARRRPAGAPFAVRGRDPGPQPINAGAWPLTAWTVTGSRVLTTSP